MGRFAILFLCAVLLCIGVVDVLGFLDPRLSVLEHWLTIFVPVAIGAYVGLSNRQRHPREP